MSSFTVTPLQPEEQQFYERYHACIKDGKLMPASSFLQQSAFKTPDAIALIYEERSMNYRELYNCAVYVSRLLQRRGIQPGDRVFLFFENSINFYIAYYGIWQTGAVVAPLNTFLHPKELEYIIQDAEPKALVVSKKAEALFAHCGVPLITEDEFTQAHDQALAPFKIPALDAHAMTVLLYTSGTTGFPKGVMLSSNNIITNVIQGVIRLNGTSSDRIFALLPLFHSFAQNACVWNALYLGAVIIIVPKIERRALTKALVHKPTIFLGVPALYGMLCLLKNLNLDAVRHFICGGDAMPDKIRASFELIYQRKLCNGYGLTEASPVVAAYVEDSLVSTNTVGKPLVGITVALKDEEGNQVLPGDTGILWIKGDNVMLGYYNAPEYTAQIMDDGWLDTGDLAYVDKQGFLVMSGRFKDVIKNKGINIYPQEIENVIMTHPAVLMVGVVGKIEEGVGEIPVVFVKLRSPAKNIEQELRALCSNALASYKVPRTITILEELPLTALGKVDKKKLKADYLLDTL
jgi:acyl-CoA synthetase (AMP-forming)/AMP-acid ligase II